MNSTEKQADFLDWGAALSNRIGGALSAAPGSLLNSAVTGTKNLFHYGSTSPSQATIAQVDAARAARDLKATQDAQLAAQHKLDAQNRAALGMGKDFYMYGLGGLGAGLILTRLHQIMSNANKPKLKYTKFGPGPQTVEEDEKLAEAATPNSELYNSIVSAPGRLVQSISGDADKKEWLPTLLLGGAATGLYGGYSIMSQLAERKRKADLQAQVEDAKKQYQKALMGKKIAADLDAAFSVMCEKTAEGENTARDTALWLANKSFEPLRWSGVMPWYLAGAVAAPGVLAAKMTYDWTRARSKDKALAEAQKARARLAGSAPIYIDPEQLAALKRVAS